MRVRLSPWITSCICVLTLAILPAESYAQTKEIDHLGKDLAAACMLARPEANIIAVADLQDSDGSNNDQGHYFSMIVSVAINLHLKSGFDVAAHNDFDSALGKRDIPKGSLVTAKSVTAVAGKVNVGTIVIGNFRRERTSYVLHLSAVRVTDGATLFSTDAQFRGDDFLDSLAKPFPPPDIGELVKIKQGTDSDGIHSPVCEHCPVPSYTNVARGAKLQGTVVFKLIVSKDGKLLTLSPQKILGLGLDDAAYDIITKRWRMKPATDQTGKPVLVIVPIEVTFRLY